MSWLLVARKDFRDAVRSRSLIALLGLFVVALVSVVVGHRLLVARPTAGGLLAALVTLTKWLVPVTALVAGYNAVVGERTGNTLRFLLGLPHSRFDVFVGKAVGRTAAVLVPVLGGFACVGVATAILYPSFGLGRLLVLAAVAVLLGATFVTLAVAVSALWRSPVRTVAAAVGAFVVCMFLWDLLPTGAYLLVHGSVPGSRVPPDWFFLISRLNPLNAYLAVLSGAFETLEPQAPAPRPLFLSGWFAVLILGGWILTSLSFGYLRFRSTDIS